MDINILDQDSLFFLYKHCNVFKSDNLFTDTCLYMWMSEDVM